MNRLGLGVQYSCGSVGLRLVLVGFILFSSFTVNEQQFVMFGFCE